MVDPYIGKGSIWRVWGKSGPALIYKNISFQLYFPSATGCGSLLAVLYGFSGSRACTLWFSWCKVQVLSVWAPTQVQMGSRCRKWAPLLTSGNIYDWLPFMATAVCSVFIFTFLIYFLFYLLFIFKKIYIWYEWIVNNSMTFKCKFNYNGWNPRCSAKNENKPFNGRFDTPTS